MDLVYVAVGLALLLGAGDALVRGAVALSLRLGVPALLVSLTIVAFGTSAPELLVAVKGALAGAPGIVFGNIVGSNIANVLLVLGAAALISRLDVKDCESLRNFMMMMAASVVFIALCWLGPLALPHALVLLTLLAFMLIDAYRAARAARASNDEIEAQLAEELGEIDHHMAGWRIAALIILGLVGLPLGASLLIDGARDLALAMGVSESAIGLTLVAVGTSLPELATTLAAAVRRQTEVAIGNVIGSNLFNILGIMGVASLFGPLALPPGFLHVDLWVMLASSAILLPFVWRYARLGRRVGLVFLATYVGYAWAALANHM